MIHCHDDMHDAENGVERIRKTNQNIFYAVTNVPSMTTLVVMTLRELRESRKWEIKWTLDGGGLRIVRKYFL
jgi:hypothetical protein